MKENEKDEKEEENKDNNNNNIIISCIFRVISHSVTVPDYRRSA